MHRLIFIGIFTVNVIFFFIFYFTQKFPIPAILIHILTLIFLSLWVVKPKKIYSLIQKNRLDLVLIACLFLLALMLRLYKADVITPGMYGDEVTIAIAGEQILSSREFVPFVDVNYGHPTPLLYLEGMATNLFGRTLTAVRLPSILFGVMSVVLFYVFLRLFFKRSVAFAVSLVLVFSYPHVAVSRLAYEITASLFFQILAVIFLYLAYKTNNVRYYVGTGLALGAGLYTYVGFRTFAIGLLLVSFIILMKKKDIIRNKIGYFLLIIVTLFISAVPLLSYSISHSDSVLARAKSLSVFGQNLPKDEVIKEIQGATTRLSYVFFFTGDPNPRVNPSAVSMFDIVTTIVSLVGLIFLFRVNKNLFIISLFLFIPSIVNDIFSLERIPEFHYYGLGHPNTLRIAGIIPIVYFWLAYGMQAIRSFSIKMGGQFYHIAFIFIVGTILLFNWFFYFSQDSIHQRFYLYNYEFNGVKMLNVVDVINKSSIKEVYLSPSFLTDSRVTYFSRRNAILKTFKPTSAEQAISAIQSRELTIFDPRLDKTLAQTLVDKSQKQSNLFNMQVLVNPLGGIDALVFSRY